MNPGALASGNAVTVQAVRSVARLHLTPGHAPRVTHLNVDTGEELDVRLDLSAGFAHSAARYSRSLLSPAFAPFARELQVALSAQRPVLEPGFLKVAHAVWAGQRPALGWPDLRATWASDPLVSSALLAQLTARFSAQDDEAPRPEA